MDKSLYPDDWQAIRNRILDRDNRACKHCGLKDRSYVTIENKSKWIPVTIEEAKHLERIGSRVTRVFLQVAHINNIKSDINPENLISLCPPCHLKMDAGWKQLKRKSK